MDPLSIAASIVGLLGAGAKVSSIIITIVSNGKDAPSHAHSVLREVTDITITLGHLQSYISGPKRPSAERGSMILFEHVLTVLTGCVLTYSELQDILRSLNINAEMGTYDRVKWMRQRSRIAGLVQQLQNHKASMTLMLTILQCETMQQAESSTQHLHSLVEEVVATNRDLADRIKGLERDRSILTDRTSRDEPRASATMAYPVDQTPDADMPQFSFEQDLNSSRVYNKDVDRHSLTSFTSSALYNTAMSVFSNLSLSQVSGISFYALPVYASDLTDSQNYVFGEQGAMQARIDVEGHKLRRVDSSTISSPQNPVHITHVIFQVEKQQFVGLPREWKDERLEKEYYQRSNITFRYKD